MKTTNREPHAPSAVLPELDEFLRPFHVHFSRSEGRQSLERYLTGLLTEHHNKNCDTIASVVPGTNQQRLHNLLTGIAFDEDDLNGQRVRTLMQLPSEGDAVLVEVDRGARSVVTDHHLLGLRRGGQLHQRFQHQGGVMPASIERIGNVCAGHREPAGH